MLYIAGVFAQLERETIAQRVRDNMFLLAEHGRWLGGSSPFGYRQYCEVQNNGIEKGKKAFFLREQLEELQAVQEIFRQAAFCTRLSDLAVLLNSVGITGRKGTPFSRQALAVLLSNPVYAAADYAMYQALQQQKAAICFSPTDTGLLVYNKRGKNGTGMQHWVAAAGVHRPAVSGQEWLAVQEKFHKKPVLLPRNTRTYSLLSGRLYCKACHAPMLPKRRGDKFDYICASKLQRGSKACSMPNLSGHHTDEQVWNALAGMPEIHASICYAVQQVNSRQNKAGREKKRQSRLWQQLIQWEQCKELTMQQRQLLQQLQGSLCQQISSDGKQGMEIQEMENVLSKHRQSILDILGLTAVWDGQQLQLLFGDIL